MSTVVLEGVRRVFGDFAAVDGVDLRVAEGEFVTLLGPSGCGKTTTLRMIAGLDHNTGGRIDIGSEVVSDAAAGLFVPPERRKLGMVFQSYAIWPHMSVFDNVAYPLRVRRRPKAEIDAAVRKALRLVEMERFADRPAPALSGGQQQRVAIARALVFEPKVLLLDEPLSNLDARLRLQMGDEFRAIQKRLGMTSVYVTHDQAEAMALSDRVVVMDRGRIQQIGAPEDIYRHPVNRTVAAFFGTPNLLDASVEGCRRNGQGVILDVAGQGWRGRCHAAQELATGARVTVMARAEDARIEPDGARVADDAGLRWSGRIASTIFRGPTRSIFVETDAGRMAVDAPAFGPFTVGDPVTVTLFPNRQPGRLPQTPSLQPMKLPFTGAVDCDLHPAPPPMSALLPYMDEYWSDQLRNRHVDRFGFTMTSHNPLLDDPWPAGLAADGGTARQRYRFDACAPGTRRVRVSAMRSATSCTARSRCSTATWRRRS